MRDERKPIRDNLKRGFTNINFEEPVTVSILCGQIMRRIEDRTWRSNERLANDIKSCITLPNDVSWNAITTD